MVRREIRRQRKSSPSGRPQRLRWGWRVETPVLAVAFPHERPPTNRRHVRRIPEQEVKPLTRTTVTSLAAATLIALAAPSPSNAAITKACQDSAAPRLCTIHQRHHHVNHMRARLEQAPIRYGWLAERHPARRPAIMRYWSLVEQRTAHRWIRFAPAYRWASGAMATCIRQHEGGYTSVNPNGHYGAYQADASFEMAYNPTAVSRYGHANRWPPREQHLMGYHGWQARGYQPWTGDGC